MIFLKALATLPGIILLEARTSVSTVSARMSSIQTSRPPRQPNPQRSIEAAVVYETTDLSNHADNGTNAGIDESIWQCILSCGMAHDPSYTRGPRSSFSGGSLRCGLAAFNSFNGYLVGEEKYGKSILERRLKIYKPFCHAMRYLATQACVRGKGFFSDRTS